LGRVAREEIVDMRGNFTALVMALLLMLIATTGCQTGNSQATAQCQEFLTTRVLTGVENSWGWFTDWRDIKVVKVESEPLTAYATQFGYQWLGTVWLQFEGKWGYDGSWGIYTGKCYATKISGTWNVGVPSVSLSP
jgi:hypothetical protein